MYGSNHSEYGWYTETAVNGWQLLSQDDKTIQGGTKAAASPPKADPNEDGGARLYSPTPATSGAYGQHKHTSHSSPHDRYHERSAWADGDGDGEADEDEDDENAASEIESPIEGPPGANYAKPQGQRQQYEQHCARTLQLSNLADGTTHADIVNAVRGGMLLDIFLRYHDRAASVSFLNSEDAKKFYDHVRRHDLYIRNKRVGCPGPRNLLSVVIDMVDRSKSSGTTASSFSRATSPTRSAWAPAATW
jgi:hypothetical protein